MRTSFKALAATALAFGALIASPAWAQSTWTYADFTTANPTGFGNSYSDTNASGITLTVTAFSTTGTGGAFAVANIGNYGAGSGFGVRNTVEGIGVSSPNHAMDNSGQTDFLALNFTNGANPTKVVLTALATGWSSGDSDISLLRWTGAAAPTITGGTFAGLLSAGWVLVNNYANMVDDVSRTTGLATTTANSSSWWLISAYNSLWTSPTATAIDLNSDYVKVLSSVTATPTAGAVPEPGSVALVGAALFALAAVRRAATSR